MKLLARITGSGSESITVWQDHDRPGYVRVETISEGNAIVVAWLATHFEVFAAELNEAMSKPEGA